MQQIKMIDQTQMVCPLQTHNLENLITAYLMGQPYDGVYDVLGNLLLTNPAALQPFSSLNNIHKAGDIAVWME